MSVVLTKCLSLGHFVNCVCTQVDSQDCHNLTGRVLEDTPENN